MRLPTRTAIAALLITLLSPLPAQADAQLPLLSAEAHESWTAIGRLNRAGHRSRAMCSATLIAPDQVLTAAHCLWGGNGRPARLEDLTFTAGWFRGEARAVAGVTQADMHPRALRDGALDPRYDLAVLTLDRTLDIPPLPLAGKGAPQQPYAIVAYEASRPHALGGRFDCSAGFPSLSYIQTICPVERGASGGPVLGQVAGEWQILGVVSARAKGLTLIPRTVGWDRLDGLNE
ncbi:MAG: serine protease [Paracoccaceae bacterium]